MKRSIVSILGLILLSAVAVFAQDTSEPSVTAQRGYLVGPGDKLVGKVMGEEDFGFEVVIDDDGMFELPYVDKLIMAKCRTERDIKEEVEREYSKFLRNPLISVQVAERRKPTPVTISGAVRTPQQVELRREARLIELISFSGEVTEEASGTIQVFRTRIPACSGESEQMNWAKESDNGRSLPSRMYSLSNVKSGAKESNPIIYPGDIIVVEKASPIYFIGEVVQKQGLYIKEGGLSLTQAIAMVGGVQSNAKTKDIKIYRLKGANPKERDEITVNYDLIKDGKQQDVMLQPYDIVDVSKKKKSMAQTVLEVVTGVGRSALTSSATGGVSRVLY